MKPVFSTLKLHEAHLLKNVLQTEGIRCRLRNEGLSLLAGEIPFPECAIQILIEREEDRGHADEVIARWTRHPPAAGPQWTCPGCGERLEAQFTACWRCAAGTPP